MANKTRIEFDGFDEAVARLTKLGADVNKVTEDALTQTHKYITQQAKSAIHPHWRTGQTEKSLVTKANVKWVGTEASVETGFNIRDGGLPSIFLMYGTPRMKKDQKLYNAFFGNQTKNHIKELQEEIFYNEIRRLNG